MNPREFYEAEHKRCVKEAKGCEAREGKYGFFRLVIFILIVIGIFKDMESMTRVIMLIGPSVAFVAMMHFHDKLKRQRLAARRAARFYKAGMERIDDEWIGKGEGEDPNPDKHHLFADDLDLFGEGSVYELLNTCRTHLGRESLADILKTTVDAQRIKERQEAVRELTDRTELRERAARLEGKLGDNKFDAYEEWTSLPELFSKSTLTIAYVLAFLGVVSVITFFADSADGAFRWMLLVVCLLQFAFYKKLTPAFEKLSSSLEQFHSQLQLLVGLFRQFENEEFTSKRGAFLKEQLKTEKGYASKQFERLDFWVEFLNHCMRNQMVILFAILLQLNVITAYYIDKWRLENSSHILKWLKALGELEALMALSAYAYENPDNNYPDIRPREDMIIDAHNMGHPLLAKKICVRNDVTIGGDARLLIISGSNMAGKSTFLRTIGVNAVLAYSGLPVRANALKISPLALGMTLKIQDSLQDGQSRFYSEIDRIRRVRDLMDGDFPVLFVLDELLSGTNSHERLIGSEALLRQFMKKKTLGMVTTHDLALTDLGSTLNQTKNIYLSEKWTDGQPDFDYKVNEGVQKQGNALQWMRALGLDV